METTIALQVGIFMVDNRPNQEIPGNNNKVAGRDLYDNCKVTHNHHYPESVRRLSSALGKILPRIAEIVSESPAAPYSPPPDIAEKIDYNNIRTHRGWIENYGQYGVSIEQLYDEIDSNSPGVKNKILGDIKAKYIRKKTELLKKISTHKQDEDILEIVRKNSDLLIEGVFEVLKQQILESKGEKLLVEDLEQGTMAVVCHAFIHCRILENPPYAY